MSERESNNKSERESMSGSESGMEEREYRVGRKH